MLIRFKFIWVPSDLGGLSANKPYENMRTQVRWSEHYHEMANFSKDIEWVDVHYDTALGTGNAKGKFITSFKLHELSTKPGQQLEFHVGPAILAIGVISSCEQN